MSLSWCQQRRRPTVRRSTRPDTRLVLSSTSLSAFLFTIFLLTMYINWLQFRGLLLPRPDENYNHHGNLESPARSNRNAGTRARDSRNDSVERFSLLDEPIHRREGRNNTNSMSLLTNDNRRNFEAPGRSIGGGSAKNSISRVHSPILRGKGRNTTFSSGLPNIIKGVSILPESKDHLMRLSLSSEVDVEHLGMQLANKSARVYKPGSWDGAGIVIEEFKLVFFTQGKVACTVFKKLFRRMMGIENWMAENGDLPHDPKTNGLTYLYHYSIPDALTMLTHPNWTRAIFVRDPKERTLSAFLDKAARKQGQYIRRHCCNTKNSTCGEEANASFLGFLRVIQERCCCDPHWRRQSKRIDRAFTPFINFVGHFDRIQVDTKRLLKSLNLNDSTENNNGIYSERSDPWTAFGASGWGTYGNESIFSKDTKARHQTSAMTKLRQYYNKSSELLVEKLFAADYGDPMLNFTRFSLFDE